MSMTWSLMTRTAPRPSGDASVMMFTRASPLADRGIFLVGRSFVTLRYSMSANLAPSNLLVTKSPSLFLVSVRFSRLDASLPDRTSVSLADITA